MNALAVEWILALSYIGWSAGFLLFYVLVHPVGSSVAVGTPRDLAAIAESSHPVVNGTLRYAEWIAALARDYRSYTTTKETQLQLALAAFMGGTLGFVSLTHDAVVANPLRALAAIPIGGALLAAIGWQNRNRRRGGRLVAACLNVSAHWLLRSPTSEDLAPVALPDESGARLPRAVVEEYLRLPDHAEVGRVELFAGIAVAACLFAGIGRVLTIVVQWVSRC